MLVKYTKKNLSLTSPNIVYIYSLALYTTISSLTFCSYNQISTIEDHLLVNILEKIFI